MRVSLVRLDSSPTSELRYQHAKRTDSFRDRHYNDDHRQRWVVLDTRAVIFAVAYLQGPRRQRRGLSRLRLIVFRRSLISTESL